MTLKPRQILLLIIVLALGAWNVYRFQKAKHLTQTTAEPEISASGADGLWQAFDHAASLRDAPADQFTAAMGSLRTAEAALPSPNLKSNADVISEIHGCTTWLEFYRAHKNDPSWKDPLAHHLKGCTEQHHDTSA